MTDKDKAALEQELEEARRKLDKAQKYFAPYDDIKKLEKRVQELEAQLGVGSGAMDEPPPAAAKAAEIAALLSSVEKSPEVAKLEEELKETGRKLEKAVKYMAPHAEIKALEKRVGDLEQEIKDALKPKARKKVDISQLLQQTPRCPECNSDWSVVGNSLTCGKCGFELKTI